MSDSDASDASETIYSESERSEDDDSEGSLADFIADDESDPETCASCYAEICPSNIKNRKRRHAEVVQEESSDDESIDDEGDEPSEDSDSSSDYAASEASDSCSEGSSSEGE